MSRLGKTLLLAAVLMLLCGFALADDDKPTLRLYDGRVPAAAGAGIELYHRSGRHYLFLPATWDAACIRVEYTGHELIHAGERPLPNGEVTDAFAAGDKILLTDARGREWMEVQVYQGSLPCLLLTTESGSTRTIHTDKMYHEPGTLLLQEVNGDVTYQDALEEIRIRGNTTMEYDKKPYQIKLENKAELIAGAGKAKTWVLLADFTDLSLLRNRLTLDLAREIGLEYSSYCRSVDVYLNGVYRGVYLLTEKVQAKTNRVEIDDQETLTAMLNPDQPLSAFERKKRTYNDLDVAWFNIPNQPQDVTGDYLLELDKASRIRADKEDGYCFTKEGYGFQVKAPAYPTQNQVEYLSDLLNTLERAIFSKDGIDPKTGTHYADLINMDSFVLKFILEDFSANYDARAGSQFFYKLSDEKGGKLYAGPGWDYDLTYASSVNMKSDTAFHTLDIMEESYYATLYQLHPEFRARVHELYEQRVRPALAKLNAGFDDYAREVAPSAAMNFLCWPKCGVQGAHFRTGRSYDEAIAYLKQFLLERTEAVGTYYQEHQ